jgi:hypothetical protein
MQAHWTCASVDMVGFLKFFILDRSGRLQPACAQSRTAHTQTLQGKETGRDGHVGNAGYDIEAMRNGTHSSWWIDTSRAYKLGWRPYCGDLAEPSY